MSAWVAKKASSSPQTSRRARDVFNFVVTPARIPQFFIPSLDIQEDQRLFSRKKALSWRSHEWHSLDEGQRDRKACRSHSDPTWRRGRGSISCTAEVARGLEDVTDPVTRSALSLTHLSKITTPYGFVTLGESPQVTHEESLFFQVDLTDPKCSPDRRSDSHQAGTRPRNIQKLCGSLAGLLTKDPGSPESPSLGPSMNNAQNKTTSIEDLNLFKRCTTRYQVPRRSSSPLRAMRGAGPPESSFSPERKRPPGIPSMAMFSQRSNSLPKVNTKRPSRNLFQTIMKKHFSNLRHLKSSNLSSH